MRFGSFIVTYNRPDALQRTIEAVLAQSAVPELVLVVDNGSGHDAKDVAASFGDSRVMYEATGTNLGSAGGVAYGMRRLVESGFDWVHSIDDDNPPPTRDTIERLQALINRHPEPEVGAVGASGTRWDWTRGEHRRIPDSELIGDIDIDTVGGNQQLVVRSEAISRVGTPEPSLFFGFYDPLYCLRLRVAGYRILAPGDLAYEYRQIFDRLMLEPKRGVVPQDPPYALWRRYYVTRNYIYRMSHTFDRPDLARREALKASRRIAASWLRGPRYGARFSALQIRGVIDGYRGRLGRTVEPQTKPRSTKGALPG